MNLSYMLTAFACYSRVAPTFSLNGIKKHLTGQSEAVVADWWKLRGQGDGVKVKTLVSHGRAF